jgi:hypothetical protein
MQSLFKRSILKIEKKFLTPIMDKEYHKPLKNKKNCHSEKALLHG